MWSIDSTFRQNLDRRLAAPMAALSFLFLLLVGGVMHRLAQPDVSRWESLALTWGVVLLWPVFIAEFLLQVVLRDRNQGFWRNHRDGLLACLIPPLRIGARSKAMGNMIWLPMMGWEKVDRQLRRRLDKMCSLPMIFIALMILPLLAIEWKWEEAIKEQPRARLLMDIGTAIIWFAFAVEFVIMVSISEKKLIYCVRHWLDLAIILLPTIAFLRSARILRLGRVAQQTSRMARLYRLRGLSLRAWRAILLLNVIQRMTGQSLEKQLTRAEDRLVEKEEEIQELRVEIDRLRDQIRQKGQAKIQDLSKQS